MIYLALLRIAMRMYGKLKARPGRKQLIRLVLDALGDGRLSEQDWMRLGNELGVFESTNRLGE